MSSPKDWVKPPAGFVTIEPETARDFEVSVIDNGDGTFTVQDRTGVVIDGIAAVTLGREQAPLDEDAWLKGEIIPALRGILESTKGQQWVGVWLRCENIYLVDRGAQRRYIAEYEAEHGEITEAEMREQIGWTPPPDPTRAIEIALEGLGTDGEHHKQWYLEEIVKALGGTVPDGEFEPGTPG